jgi:site-specific recombinase XerD
VEPNRPHGTLLSTDGTAEGASSTSRPVAPSMSFPEAVELFIGRTRHTRTGSPHTERAYRSDLRHYGRFLHALHLPFDAVARRDAERYLTRLSAEGAPRSVSRRVSCVRSFYRFLRGVEAVTANPFDALDLPTFDRKSETHKVLSDDELERVVALLGRDVEDANRRLAAAPRGPQRTRAFGRLFTAARRRAILSLMAFAGLRCAEALGLQRDAILSRPDGFALSFTGKGGKSRTVPLVGFVYPAMFDWLAVRRHVPTSADVVFVTLTGHPVRPRQVARDCIRTGERARTRYRLTPHVLRRTFATRSLRASGDIRAVQVLLGHASIQTTEVYTHVDEEGLRELVESTALGSAATGEHARGPLLRSVVTSV